MKYQLNIDNHTILSGDLFVLIIIIILLLAIIFFVLSKIWKRLNAVEKLKYEFVTIIAHKFRTPLTQIKWFLETVKETETNSFIKDSLVNMGEANQKLIDLTNTLIGLSDERKASKASYSFDKVNLCELIAQITHSLKDTFHKKNLFLATQCSESEIFVKADKQRIDFVIQTIIENAINYSPAGRSIEISIDKEEKDIIIYVQDHGIGIEANDINRLFTKFFRAKNAMVMDTEGFGIGLYLAQKIMKEHNGKITAYSEGVDKGSIFSIIFPKI